MGLAPYAVPGRPRGPYCALGIPLRADALACVMLAPWDFLLRAREYGDVSGPAMERLLTNCPRKAEPTAVATAGLAACDVVLDDGDMVATGGGRLHDFVAPPRLAVLRWLAGCLRSAEWCRLEARRVDYRGLAEPDTAATAIALGAVAGRDREAALRAVLVGSVVTQVVAARSMPAGGRGLEPPLLEVPGDRRRPAAPRVLAPGGGHGAAWPRSPAARPAPRAHRDGGGLLPAASAAGAAGGGVD